MSNNEAPSAAVRVAFIGDSAVAEIYARHLSRLKNSIFTAFASPDVEQGRHAAESLHASRFCQGSGIDLLNDHADEFDAVAIHAPIHQRKGLAELAIRRGKHLYISAPISFDEHETNEIIELAKGANVSLTIGHVERFLPAIQTVKQVLDAGKLGTPGLLRIHRWNTAGVTNETTASDEMIATETNAIRRALPDLDLARWFFGTLPTEMYVLGAATPLSPEDSFDYIQLHLGFPNGGMALIDNTRSLRGANNYYSLSVIGASGAAYADDHHNQQLLFHGDSPPTALLTGQGDLHHIKAFAEFLSRIPGTSPKPAAPMDEQAELDVIKIVSAAELSFSKKRSVQLVGDQYELR
ncbi:MAG: Gfo/Idh/MocA family protein [Planctomycetaceae bacterium]